MSGIEVTSARALKERESCRYLICARQKYFPTHHCALPRIFQSLTLERMNHTKKTAYISRVSDQMPYAEGPIRIPSVVSTAERTFRRHREQIRSDSQFARGLEPELDVPP